ncbi:Ubiquinone/menaquinone biosynthesis methyltransferase ubiE [Flexistipes sinusarabici DSM 4947]|uniref:Demethylmenaquinone methyltransferase n=2 Tax=Flexistipes sinusarabici TaxID=2352 RepID=F8E6P6_FLESM|nr:bifunctional demethylmenaquinone methyltransferase/2-methoxy-6-polyprenyl-1,4-benzoquinol methylase UbiE [Flexistipes sinusarabici]AEI15936.1 Ubiquinone/menaquinone biosynthesis methyltransferase ubiE [Flexistipes sinusarabici DSM 4947]HCW92985.1 bifunctional demethylmenaquinone methyltransferase/2-methoxy-6-polyprenyl-1,4-benzoquinol methylase UbiE [Flexistipes sinusarabici]
MEEKSKKIQRMFDGIADRYDLLNRLLSFRRDVAWRKKAIELLEVKENHKILDLACGTGDMIGELKRQTKNSDIIGADFSKNMLFKAKRKQPDIMLLAGDAHSLPFKPDSFDRVMIAFGFRNVTDKNKGLEELFRVVKPGGRLCILEFSQPEGFVFSRLYRLYFTKILPFLGGLISGDRRAYEYLPDSVYKFPPKNEYKKMIIESGFERVQFNPMTFGICDATICFK